MDYPKLFSEIRRRPELYGLDGSYRGFCAFLHGVDAGNDRQLLAGFSEMLIVRLGTGNNLVWPALVLNLAFPGAAAEWSDDDPAQRQPAVDLLFDLLDEFLARRSTPDGRAAIYDEYLTWLKAQSWYRPKPPA